MSDTEIDRYMVVVREYDGTEHIIRVATSDNVMVFETRADAIKGGKEACTVVGDSFEVYRCSSEGVALSVRYKVQWSWGFH